MTYEASVVLENNDETLKSLELAMEQQIDAKSFLAEDIKCEVLVTRKDKILN